MCTQTVRKNRIIFLIFGKIGLCVAVLGYWYGSGVLGVVIEGVDSGNRKENRDIGFINVKIGRVVRKNRISFLIFGKIGLRNAVPVLYVLRGVERCENILS